MTTHPIRPISTRMVYENPWTKVREDEIEFPDGSTGIYGVVEKPDYSIVIPYVSVETIVLVRQYRYAVRDWTLEFPQGYVANSTPEEIARTELVEETGYEAAQLRQVGNYYQSTGLSNQSGQVFVANDLTYVGTKLEPSEVAAGLTVVEVPVDEFEAMIVSGEITDVSTIAAWYLAKSRSV